MADCKTVFTQPTSKFENSVTDRIILSKRTLSHRPISFSYINPARRIPWEEGGGKGKMVMSEI